MTEEINPLVFELVELGNQCGPGTNVSGSTREEISENLRAAFDKYEKAKKEAKAKKAAVKKKSEDIDKTITRVSEEAKKIFEKTEED